MLQNNGRQRKGDEKVDDKIFAEIELDQSRRLLFPESKVLSICLHVRSESLDEPVNDKHQHQSIRQLVDKEVVPPEIQWCHDDVHQRDCEDAPLPTQPPKGERVEMILPFPILDHVHGVW